MIEYYSLRNCKHEPLDHLKYNLWVFFSGRLGNLLFLRNQSHIVRNLTPSPFVNAVGALLCDKIQFCVSGVSVSKCIAVTNSSKWTEKIVAVHLHVKFQNLSKQC